MTDLQQAFDEGFDAVKGYVDRTFAAFEKRIGEIESRNSIQALVDKLDIHPDDGRPATNRSVRAVAAVTGKAIGDELRSRDARLDKLEEAVRGIFKIVDAQR